MWLSVLISMLFHVSHGSLNPRMVIYQAQSCTCNTLASRLWISAVITHCLSENTPVISNCSKLSAITQFSGWTQRHLCSCKQKHLPAVTWEKNVYTDWTSPCRHVREITRHLCWMRWDTKKWTNLMTVNSVHRSHNSSSTTHNFQPHKAKLEFIQARYLHTSNTSLRAVFCQTRPPWSCSRRWL